MTCDTTSYRVAVGQFNQNKKSNRKIRNIERKKRQNTYPSSHLPAYVTTWFNLFIILANTTTLPQNTSITHCTNTSKSQKICLLLLIVFINLLVTCGDIHPNPGPFPTNTTKLSVYFLNAQSLKANSKDKSKLNDFRHMVDILQPDIIAVNETWLIKEVPDSDICDSKYLLYRKDRGAPTTGGGVLIMIKKSIWSKERPEWESQDPQNNEITCAEIRPNKDRSIAIITAYRPQTNPCPAFLQNLDTVLTKCLQHNVGEFIILGDFNYSDIKWNPTEDTHLPKHCRELIQYLQQHNLTQLIHQPSRKGELNILDLIITNLEDEVTDVTRGRYSYTSDHYLFDCEFKMKVLRREERPRKTFNFRRANYDAIKRKLSLKFRADHNTNDTEASWKSLKSIIDTTTKQYIPTINIKNKSNPAWIDDEVIRASRKKKSALKKSKTTKDPKDINKFKQLRNSLKNLVTFKYKEYISNITEHVGTNPKRFWKLLKDRSKSKCSPSVITSDGKDTTDPNEKSTIFNKYFQSVFTSKTHITLPPIDTHVDPELENVIITEEEVLNQLKKLNPSKAAGPDELQTRILQETAETIVKPCTDLFNQSLQEGTVPKEWKRANVVPIFKKGRKTDPSNYRPISLLPIISKILERCIFNHIIGNLSKKLSPLQHGFMRKRSTVTQLMETLCRLSTILDNKKRTDVIYFDLSKAFDSVPHDLLIHKLKQFGINGRLLTWIKDYLTNRYQRVTCDGGTSLWLPVTSGVPQGSILGPLLFLLYINDLPDVLSAETYCAIFADDTKIYRQISNPHDALQLQSDIDKLGKWGNTWDLKFNSKKCVSLTITTKDVAEPMYVLHNTSITHQHNMNDLGIYVNSDLKWKVHINKMTAKANQRLWLLVRTLGYDAPPKAKKMAYISMVRSLLEYGSVLWNPTDKESMQQVEKVQRQATNFITNNVHRTVPGYKDYKTRLLETGLLPLSYRREIGDLIFFCRSYNGDIAFDIKNYINFPTRGTGAITRGVEQSITLPVPRTKSTTAAHFYPTRIARLWNSLPPELRRSLKHLTNGLTIKQHLSPLLKNELTNRFDPEDTCSWIHFCHCRRCSIT